MYNFLNLKKVFNKFRYRVSRIINCQFFSLWRKIKAIGITRTLWLIEYSEWQQGGLNSAQGRGPLDGFGDASPWYTYPAIEYLKQLDLTDATLFEYGSGNSTNFWRSRVKEIVSVESSPEWFSLVSGNQTLNQKIMLRTEKAEYINSIKEVNATYDIIVVDGEYRQLCAISALDFLKKDGMLILDNSDWFTDITGELRSRGYMQIDFIGQGPINSYAWSTSIFIKEISKYSRQFLNGSIDVVGGITEDGIRK
ncbi:hypothetical protein [Polynucleobacter sp. UB-Piko-W3]|uniref:hypothetical protein n=1 Tax=Polynucleobacter sp. UB-Piko-W3 TaxID=1819735 RepID=UPI001C0D98A9|nr:hypothetical protein [Polynucleobacter sp. UB-Piko-W3]MBU3553980.1 hypothetical protein [Polynucleobacter sp. UB-Piko-W3]